MEDDFIVFGAPSIREPEIAEVVECLRSGWVGTGPRVARFERMLEDYLGAAHVRCVASGTAALVLGMEALGIGPGDEVLLPAMTFVACANAVEQVGATPVFVDVDFDTGLIDFECAEQSVTLRTRAIMAVHLAGYPICIEELSAFSKRHDLAVIEDAAHAIGAEWQGRKIGSHGHLTTFSFYVTKNITTIEGGAVATEDPEVAAEIERRALHGLSKGAWERFGDKGYRHYEVVKPGYKFNMTDVQAALGLHQLPRLDAWIAERERVWRGYDRLLAGLPVTLPPDGPERGKHARHLYSIRVGPDAGLDRDVVMDQLIKRGIGAGVHYRAIHLHPYYRDRYGRDSADPKRLPVATQISAETLSLPLGPDVSSRDQFRVAAALREALQS